VDVVIVRASYHPTPKLKEEWQVQRNHKTHKRN